MADDPVTTKTAIAAPPRCDRCNLPMDPYLAQLENWSTHPSCDPRHFIYRNT